MTTGTKCNFGMHAPRIRPVMIPDFFEKGVWLGSRDTVIFWALNVNSSKMVEAIRYCTVQICVTSESTCRLNIANSDQVTYDVI